MAEARSRSVHMVILAAGGAGVLQLFLPFTFGESPLSAIHASDRVWMIALPFFLAPAACYVAVRSIAGIALSSVERWFAIGLSAIVAAITTVFFVLPSLVLREGGTGPSTRREWARLCVPMAIAVCEATWLWRLRRRAPADSRFAEACLVCAYLPNAALCLIVFSDSWQVGAYLTMAIVIAFVAALGMLGQLWSDRGRPMRPAATVPM